MKKNEILITITFFLTILIVMMMPGVIPAFGVPGNTTYFNVTVTVSGGSPTITYVDSVSDNPNEGTTKTVHFYFNATHPNGIANIPAANARVRINQSGVTLIDSGCAVNSTDSVSTNRFDCNITISYYHLPGTWTINASITDFAANFVNNTASSYTNGNIQGIILKTTSITFGGNAGDADIAAGQNPQQVNNTGNVAFSQINLTAFNLQSGANYIGAGNFTANTTNGGGLGQMLANNTVVTLADSSLAVNGSRDMYLYLDIPNGLSNGTYASVSQWVVTVG